jgi:hypothetical protein
MAAGGHSRPGSRQVTCAINCAGQIDLHRGNGIPRPRDKRPKIAFRPETVSAETETQPPKTANCGLLGRLREIFRFEGLRGGPDRIRTAHHTIMAPRPNWILSPLGFWAADPARTARFPAHAPCTYVSAAREPTAPPRSAEKQRWTEDVRGRDPQCCTVNPGPRHGPTTARHAKSLRPRRH